MFTRAQLTFNMGPGEKGEALKKLLDEQAQRFRARSHSEVLRIALTTLAKTKDKDVVKEQ